MATELADGTGAGVEKIEKEIEEYQKKQGAALASMVSRITSYAIRKLEDFFNAPIEEVLLFLDQNQDIMDYKIIDDEISNIKNPTIRFALNALTRAGGTILRNNDSWREEFLSEGEKFILAALKKHNPSLFDLLKDKPHVVSFIKGYIAYKLGL